MSTPADQLPPVPVTPDLFIPQVPLKQLPFPWNDLTNTPQPDATQYYPDHAPSVVATLAGMHPTDQQGQTVNTDGNHALLVKSVGGGGGSTENHKRSINANNVQFELDDSNHNAEFTISTPELLWYALFMSITVTVSGSSVWPSDGVSIILKADPFGPGIHLGALMANVGETANAYFPYTPPINPVESGLSASSLLLIYSSIFGGTIAVTSGIIVGPVS